MTGSAFMARPFSLCARIGTMNPPLTPPRGGTDRTRRYACSPPGRGRGWVGSWIVASCRRFRDELTLRQTAVQIHPGDRGKARLEKREQRDRGPTAGPTPPIIAAPGQMGEVAAKEFTQPIGKDHADDKAQQKCANHVEPGERECKSDKRQGEK